MKKDNDELLMKVIKVLIEIEPEFQERLEMEDILEINPKFDKKLFVKKEEKIDKSEEIVYNEKVNYKNFNGSTIEEKLKLMGFSSDEVKNIYKDKLDND